MTKRYKEVDIFVFDVKTDTSEMSVDALTNDISHIRKDLQDMHGYRNDRIKSIKFRIKRRGMVRI